MIGGALSSKDTDGRGDDVAEVADLVSDPERCSPSCASFQSITLCELETAITPVVTGPFSNNGSSPGLTSTAFSRNPTLIAPSTFRAEGVSERRSLPEERGVSSRYRDLDVTVLGVAKAFAPEGRERWVAAGAIEGIGRGP